MAAKLLLATSPGGGQPFRTATLAEQIADMTASLVSGVLDAVRAATVAALADARASVVRKLCDGVIVDARLEAWRRKRVTCPVCGRRVPQGDVAACIDRDNAIDWAITEKRLRALREHPERPIPAEEVARQLGIKPAPKKRARRK